MTIQFKLFPAQMPCEKDDELRQCLWQEAEEWVETHGERFVTATTLYHISMAKLKAMGFTDEQLTMMPQHRKDILEGFVNYATLEEQREEMKKEYADCNIKWPW